MNIELQLALASSHRNWTSKEIQDTFFKCTKWQFEATMDPVNCPFHYFCESTYPGDYSSIVDFATLVITMISYLGALLVTTMGIYRASQESVFRYLIPSGPLFLPINLLVLANGQRINTTFPLYIVGPFILLLIQISSLVFDSEDKENVVKYVFFKVSTISGILHVGLHLDTITLPYYTGLDALVSSTFSGECPSCVCRKEELIVGGKVISYRGLSVTMFVLVACLCLKILYKMSNQSHKNVAIMKLLLEKLVWLCISVDCVSVIKQFSLERSFLHVATSTCLSLLICLHFVQNICKFLIQWFHCF
ncbi:uncharacterized protein LOC124943848 [Impatiens glandulifera]|uniref:uncharacterized protein LOC124943848 n=1 Tax=Impatiens glandulifera TaxID=253017 RepID=UPI001FB19BB8|nr:uncharacterized protein LOC124943848 [Impatiens glandulifera]